MSQGLCGLGIEESGKLEAFELSSLPGESHLPGCPALHCLNSQTLSEIGLSHRGQSDTLKKVNMVSPDLK